jgi:hypothetical protein
MVVTRRRCLECGCRFTPSTRARTTQRVCGAACRVARDRKLARRRRRREIVEYRAEERDRQQAVRDERARAKREAASIDAPRHAPASAANSLDLREEFARLVDRAVEASRASLQRDLSRIWPRFCANLAKAGTASRASFGGQVGEFTARSEPDLATRHA